MTRVTRTVCLVALAVAAAASSAVGTPAATCTATAADAFGPFGRGMPPVRSKIGAGHVLTGVVLSAAGCKPLRHASVQFWQANRNGVYTRAGSGTVFTDRNGRFRFEGPVPTPYEGLPGHIHIRVTAPEHVSLLARYVPAPGEKHGTVRLVLRPAAL
jgi:protocatechuate 3,4-dioxygenase beta subunit